MKITVWLSPSDRKIATEAAPKIHNISLHFWLKRQIAKLINQAKSEYPDRFSLPVELRPVDRTILTFLMTEGNYPHVDSDLAQELGLRLNVVRLSLARLEKAGLVEVRNQGGKPDVNRGGTKKIYIPYNYSID